MVPFPMTLNEPYSYSYNGGLIESHTWSIEPRLFNDHEGRHTQISRSGHSLTLNISKMAADTAIVTMEGVGE